MNVTSTTTNATGDDDHALFATTDEATIDGAPTAAGVSGGGGSGVPRTKLDLLHRMYYNGRQTSNDYLSPAAGHVVSNNSNGNGDAALEANKRVLDALYKRWRRAREREREAAAAAAEAEGRRLAGEKQQQQRRLRGDDDIGDDDDDDEEIDADYEGMGSLKAINSRKVRQGATPKRGSSSNLSASFLAKHRKLKREERARKQKPHPSTTSIDRGDGIGGGGVFSEKEASYISTATYSSSAASSLFGGDNDDNDSSSYSSDGSFVDGELSVSAIRNGGGGAAAKAAGPEQKGAAAGARGGGNRGGGGLGINLFDLAMIATKKADDINDIYAMGAKGAMQILSGLGGGGPLASDASSASSYSSSSSCSSTSSSFSVSSSPEQESDGKRKANKKPEADPRGERRQSVLASENSPLAVIKREKQRRSQSAFDALRDRLAGEEEIKEDHSAPSGKERRGGSSSNKNRRSRSRSSRATASQRQRATKSDAAATAAAARRAADAMAVRSAVDSRWAAAVQKSPLQRLSPLDVEELRVAWLCAAALKKANVGWRTEVRRRLEAVGMVDRVQRRDEAEAEAERQRQREEREKQEDLRREKERAEFGGGEGSWGSGGGGGGAKEGPTMMITSENGHEQQHKNKAIPNAAAAEEETSMRSLHSASLSHRSPASGTSPKSTAVTPTNAAAHQRRTNSPPFASSVSAPRGSSRGGVRSRGGSPAAAAKRTSPLRSPIKNQSSIGAGESSGSGNGAPPHSSSTNSPRRRAHHAGGRQADLDAIAEDLADDSKKGNSNAGGAPPLPPSPKSGKSNSEDPSANIHALAAHRSRIPNALLLELFAKHNYYQTFADHNTDGTPSSGNNSSNKSINAYSNGSNGVGGGDNGAAARPLSPSAAAAAASASGGLHVSPFQRRQQAAAERALQRQAPLSLAQQLRKEARDKAHQKKMESEIAERERRQRLSLNAAAAATPQSGSPSAAAATSMAEAARRIFRYQTPADAAADAFIPNDPLNRQIYLGSGAGITSDHRKHSAPALLSKADNSSSSLTTAAAYLSLPPTVPRHILDDLPMLNTDLTQPEFAALLKRFLIRSGTFDDRGMKQSLYQLLVQIVREEAAAESAGHNDNDEDGGNNARADIHSLFTKGEGRRRRKKERREEKEKKMKATAIGVSFAPISTELDSAATVAGGKPAGSPTTTTPAASPTSQSGTGDGAFTWRPTSRQQQNPSNGDTSSSQPRSPTAANDNNNNNNNNNNNPLALLPDGNNGNGNGNANDNGIEQAKSGVTRGTELASFLLALFGAVDANRRAAVSWDELLTHLLAEVYGIEADSRHSGAGGLTVSVKMLREEIAMAGGIRAVVRASRRSGKWGGDHDEDPNNKRNDDNEDTEKEENYFDSHMDEEEARMARYRAIAVANTKSTASAALERLKKVSSKVDSLPPTAIAAEFMRRKRQLKKVQKEEAKRRGGGGGADGGSLFATAKAGGRGGIGDGTDGGGNSAISADSFAIVEKKGYSLSYPAYAVHKITTLKAFPQWGAVVAIDGKSAAIFSYEDVDSWGKIGAETGGGADTNGNGTDAASSSSPTGAGGGSGKPPAGPSAASPSPGRRRTPSSSSATPSSGQQQPQRQSTAAAKMLRSAAELKKKKQSGHAYAQQDDDVVGGARYLQFEAKIMAVECLARDRLLVFSVGEREQLHLFQIGESGSTGGGLAGGSGLAKTNTNLRFLGKFELPIFSLDTHERIDKDQRMREIRAKAEAIARNSSVAAVSGGGPAADLQQQQQQQHKDEGATDEDITGEEVRGAKRPQSSASLPATSSPHKGAAAVDLPPLSPSKANNALVATTTTATASASANHNASAAAAMSAVSGLTTITCLSVWRDKTNAIVGVGNGTGGSAMLLLGATRDGIFFGLSVHDVDGIRRSGVAQILFQYRLHTAPISDMCVLPGSGRVVTCALDGRLLSHVPNGAGKGGGGNNNTKNAAARGNNGGRSSLDGATTVKEEPEEATATNVSPSRRRPPSSSAAAAASAIAAADNYSSLAPPWRRTLVEYVGGHERSITTVAYCGNHEATAGGGKRGGNNGGDDDDDEFVGSNNNNSNDGIDGGSSAGGSHSGEVFVSGGLEFKVYCWAGTMTRPLLVFSDATGAPIRSPIVRLMGVPKTPLVYAVDASGLVKLFDVRNGRPLGTWRTAGGRVGGGAGNGGSSVVTMSSAGAAGGGGKGGAAFESADEDSDVDGDDGAGAGGGGGGGGGASPAATLQQQAEERRRRRLLGAAVGGGKSSSSRGLASALEGMLTVSGGGGPAAVLSACYTGGAHRTLLFGAGAIGRFHTEARSEAANKASHETVLAIGISRTTIITVTVSTLRTWAAGSGKVIATYSTDTYSVSPTAAASVDSAAGVVFLGKENGFVEAFDASDGQMLRRYCYHTSPIVTIRLDLDCGLVVSAARAGDVCVWRNRDAATHGAYVGAADPNVLAAKRVRYGVADPTDEAAFFSAADRSAGGGGNMHGENDVNDNDDDDSKKRREEAAAHRRRKTLSRREEAMTGSNRNLLTLTGTESSGGGKKQQQQRSNGNRRVVEVMEQSPWLGLGDNGLSSASATLVPMHLQRARQAAAASGAMPLTTCGPSSSLFSAGVSTSPPNRRRLTNAPNTSASSAALFPSLAQISPPVGATTDPTVLTGRIGAREDAYRTQLCNEARLAWWAYHRWCRLCRRRSLARGQDNQQHHSRIVSSPVQVLHCGAAASGAGAAERGGAHHPIVAATIDPQLMRVAVVLAFNTVIVFDYAWCGAQEHFGLRVDRSHENNNNGDASRPHSSHSNRKGGDSNTMGGDDGGGGVGGSGNGSLRRSANTIVTLVTHRTVVGNDPSAMLGLATACLAGNMLFTSDVNGLVYAWLLRSTFYSPPLSSSFGNDTSIGGGGDVGVCGRGSNGHCGGGSSSKCRGAMVFDGGDAFFASARVTPTPSIAAAAVSDGEVGRTFSSAHNRSHAAAAEHFADPYAGVSPATFGLSFNPRIAPPLLPPPEHRLPIFHPNPIAHREAAERGHAFAVKSIQNAYAFGPAAPPMLLAAWRAHRSQASVAKERLRRRKKRRRDALDAAKRHLFGIGEDGDRLWGESDGGRPSSPLRQPPRSASTAKASGKTKSKGSVLVHGNGSGGGGSNDGQAGEGGLSELLGRSDSDASFDEADLVEPPLPAAVASAIAAAATSGSNGPSNVTATASPTLAASESSREGAAFFYGDGTQQQQRPIGSAGGRKRRRIGDNGGAVSIAALVSSNGSTASRRVPPPYTTTADGGYPAGSLDADRSGAAIPMLLPPPTSAAPVKNRASPSAAAADSGNNSISTKHAAAAKSNSNSNNSNNTTKNNLSEMMATIMPHVTSLAYDPTRATLITGDDTGEVHLWEVEPLLSAVCANPRRQTLLRVSRLDGVPSAAVPIASPATNATTTSAEAIAAGANNSNSRPMSESGLDADAASQIVATSSSGGGVAASASAGSKDTTAKTAGQRQGGSGANNNSNAKATRLGVDEDEDDIEDRRRRLFSQRIAARPTGCPPRHVFGWRATGGAHISLAAPIPPTAGWNFCGLVTVSGDRTVAFWGMGGDEVASLRQGPVVDRSWDIPNNWLLERVGLVRGRWLKFINGVHSAYLTALAKAEAAERDREAARRAAAAAQLAAGRAEARRQREEAAALLGMTEEDMALRRSPRGGTTTASPRGVRGGAGAAAAAALNNRLLMRGNNGSALSSPLSASARLRSVTILANSPVSSGLSPPATAATVAAAEGRSSVAASGSPKVSSATVLSSSQPTNQSVLVGAAAAATSKSSAPPSSAPSPSSSPPSYSAHGDRLLAAAIEEKRALTAAAMHASGGWGWARADADLLEAVLVGHWLSRAEAAAVRAFRVEVARQRQRAETAAAAGALNRRTASFVALRSAASLAEKESGTLSATRPGDVTTEERGKKHPTEGPDGGIPLASVSVASGSDSSDAEADGNDAAAAALRPSNSTVPLCASPSVAMGGEEAAEADSAESGDDAEGAGGSLQQRLANPILRRPFQTPHLRQVALGDGQTFTGAAALLSPADELNNTAPQPPRLKMTQIEAQFALAGARGGGADGLLAAGAGGKKAGGGAGRRAAAGAMLQAKPKIPMNPAGVSPAIRGATSNESKVSAIGIGAETLRPPTTAAAVGAHGLDMAARFGVGVGDSSGMGKGPIAPTSIGSGGDGGGGGVPQSALIPSSRTLVLPPLSTVHALPPPPPIAKEDGDRSGVAAAAAAIAGQQGSNNTDAANASAISPSGGGGSSGALAEAGRKPTVLGRIDAAVSTFLCLHERARPTLKLDSRVRLHTAPQSHSMLGDDADHRAAMVASAAVSAIQRAEDDDFINKNFSSSSSSGEDASDDDSSGFNANESAPTSRRDGGGYSPSPSGFHSPSRRELLLKTMEKAAAAMERSPADGDLSPDGVEGEASKRRRQATAALENANISLRPHEHYGIAIQRRELFTPQPVRGKRHKQSPLPLGLARTPLGTASFGQDLSAISEAETEAEKDLRRRRRQKEAEDDQIRGMAAPEVDARLLVVPARLPPPKATDYQRVLRGDTLTTPIHPKVRGVLGAVSLGGRCGAQTAVLTAIPRRNPSRDAKTQSEGSSAQKAKGGESM